MLTSPITSEDHIQGDANAPMILVEYGDYQCPHCGHAHPIIKKVQKHFGSKLAFVFRNFPLNEIHPDAEAAAETAEFASVNGDFWAMHDAIFENQSKLSVEYLLKLAKRLSLDAEKLAAALQAGEFTARVKKDFMSGVRAGVNGTPTFFINGQRHDDSFEFDDLVAAIQSRLTHS